MLGGIGLALAGYATVTVVGGWQYGLHSAYVSRGIVVTLVCLVAMVIAARGREVTGGIIAIVATWLEVQTGIISIGVFPSPGLLVLPVLTLAIGLLAGARVALVATVLTIVSTYVTNQFSPAVVDGHRDPSFVYWFTLHVISMCSAWVLLTLSLTGVGRVMTELSRKERDYADTIRFAPDGILVIDGAHHVVLANPAAQSILDLPETSILGRHIDDVMREAARADGVVELPRDTGESAVAMRLASRDGTAVHVEATSRRMEEDRYQLLLRNVTDRVRADAQRREIELQLAHAQRLEAVGQLAGGLSHDFNNILTAVAGSADLLRDEKDPLERAALLREISAASDRGSALTRQLLAFARREVLQPQVIALGSHVQSMQRLLQRVLGDRSRLRIDIAGECRVRIDPGQLEQALVNLVSNARDAMPRGGQCVVSVACTSASDGTMRTQLHVIDEGVGMPPDVAARAFEPFFTTKPRGQGTGLGLSSVHGMATQNGGTARIVSREGAGTQVTLEFPCVSEAITSTLASASSPTVRADALTVLLAEDDDATRTVVARMLRQAGYVVVPAVDGADALQLMLSGQVHVDLVLTDVMMPGLTGPAFVERLRQQYPTLPVLFMTGYADGSLIDVEHLPNEQQVIAKPFSISALTTRLAKLAGPGAG